MSNNDSFLPTWLDSLAEGYTLTAEDLPRLARAAQAIRNGVKHHEQARAAADTPMHFGIGWHNGQSVFTSTPVEEQRDER